MAEDLARDLNILPLLAQCLLNRSLSEPASIERFLDPRLRHLADPFLLPDMAAAVQRLFHARQANELVVLFGDYDVDGVTSTAVLLEVLGALGWRLEYYLPNRRDEGYGLTLEALENCLHRFPAKLVLAVDCGSTSNDSIAWLQQRGVDVIVLDHHQVSSPAPQAHALVNPLAARISPESLGGTSDPGNRAPFSELCSAGLAFKLAHAVVKRGRENAFPGAADFDLRPLLDLVAIGAIADLVPLIGENRILVSAGLARLSCTPRPGLVALKNVARCGPSPGAFEVAFQLAPRLNAAGRLQTAEDSLRLLLARQADEAMALALTLDSRNLERKQLERRIFEEAQALIQPRFRPDTDYVIVEGHGLWHIGVVGIVAARLVQSYHRPTIIVGGEGGAWRGSGRSIAGFDLAAALRQCGDLLTRHGGHAMAAGLSLAPGNLDALRARLNQLAKDALHGDALLPPLALDAEVRLDQLTLESLVQLARIQPVGQANPPPQFVVRNLVHQRPPRRLGPARQHLKLWVSDGETAREAIWWRAGEQALPSAPFDLAVAPQIDDYNGRRSVLLKVLDWNPSRC